jgi:hypothetical protein
MTSEQGFQTSDRPKTRAFSSRRSAQTLKALLHSGFDKILVRVEMVLEVGNGPTMEIRAIGAEERDCKIFCVRG